MSVEALILETGGLLSPREARVLKRLNLMADGPRLEVGAYTGLSTVLLGTTCDGEVFVTVDTFDWRDARRAFDQTVEGRMGHLDFRVEQGRFQDQLARPRVWGFVFYDGPHDHGSQVEFWNLIREQVRPGGMMVIDDADWSPTLCDLVDGEGWTRVDLPDVYRHVIAYSTGIEQVDFDLGKRHPDTFTLAAWVR